MKSKLGLKIRLNQREGFRESFQPLISQFEKPEDDETRNIFTQKPGNA